MHAAHTCRADRRAVPCRDASRHLKRAPSFHPGCLVFRHALHPGLAPLPISVRPPSLPRPARRLPVSCSAQRRGGGSFGGRAIVIQAGVAGRRIPARPEPAGLSGGPGFRGGPAGGAAGPHDALVRAVHDGAGGELRLLPQPAPRAWREAPGEDPARTGEPALVLGGILPGHDRDGVTAGTTAPPSRIRRDAPPPRRRARFSRQAFVDCTTHRVTRSLEVKACMGSLSSAAPRWFA